MTSAAIVAFGAVSAFGEGPDAASAGEVGAGARVAVVRDPELSLAGLARPFAARALPVDAGARASALLDRALSSCARELDRERPGWRRERVGLVVGTSSGGMRAAEQAFAALAGAGPVPDRRAPTYWGPLDGPVKDLGVVLDPCVLVLGACASAALAIGLASRWLDRGGCDLVLAGGFDEVTVFVAAGFESLRATTAAPPSRPFRIGRDGMSLGEGAAILALAREAGSRARAFVTGFGAASDAVHLTAPDRNGAGLARAGRRALAEAGPGPVDLVSAHATATPFNDAAEARALVSILGEQARDVVVHPFKAQVGHTLGAAGALEVLVCVDAMARGILPAAAGEGALDPDAAVPLLERARAGRPRRALKLASAFGGANAALAISLDPGRRSAPRRAAFLHGAVRVASEWATSELVACAKLSAERVDRADRLVRLGLSALAALSREEGSLEGAGLVVGTAMGPLDTNADFAARMRANGARAAEPRRFAYTSPTTVVGEGSIAFGLIGPTFAVGGGMHAGVEALIAAALLVEAGDAERMVVLAVDDVGPVTRALGGDRLETGAVALLVSASAGPSARARVGSASIRRGGPASEPGLPGHLALLPLARGPVPLNVVAVSPPDVTARLELDFDTSTSGRGPGPDL